MTLVAIARRDDMIEFITDSLAYSPRKIQVFTATKTLLLPHLDAAVITQGDGPFGDIALATMLCSANQAGSFDTLTTAGTSVLQELWAEEQRERPKGIATPSCVHVAGWSEGRARFVAYSLSSTEGFALRDIEAFSMMPAPWGTPPTRHEVNTFPDGWVDAADLQKWTDCPEPPLPDSVDDWCRRAIAARRDRTENHYLRWPIGGAINLTRLGRGVATVQRIMEFDTTPEELLTYVEGSWHSVAQAAPCPFCESGRPFRECHLLEEVHEICDCGSGMPFGDCCFLTEAQESAL